MLCCVKHGYMLDWITANGGEKYAGELSNKIALNKRNEQIYCKTKNQPNDNDGFCDCNHCIS